MMREDSDGFHQFFPNHHTTAPLCSFLEKAGRRELGEGEFKLSWERKRQRRGKEKESGLYGNGSDGSNEVQ